MPFNLTTLTYFPTICVWSTLEMIPNPDLGSTLTIGIRLTFFFRLPFVCLHYMFYATQFWDNIVKCCSVFSSIPIHVHLCMFMCSQIWSLLSKPSFVGCLIQFLSFLTVRHFLMDWNTQTLFRYSLASFLIFLKLKSNVESGRWSLVVHKSFTLQETS